MKITSFIALTSFLLFGIASQVQASENQSIASLELESQKYMMSAHLSNNGGSQPYGGGGRRFAETFSLESQENSITPKRGSGR